MPSLDKRKREKLCQELLNGCTYAEAAKRAGYSETYARDCARDFAKSGPMQARIKELQEMATTNAIMSVIRRKERLSQIAEAKETKNSDVIDAIAELNKMEGSYAPTHIESKSERVVIKTLEYFGPDNPRPIFPPAATPQIEAP